MKTATICTKEAPHPVDYSELTQHPDAVVIDRAAHWDGTNWELLRCPNCGLRFSVQVPMSPGESDADRKMLANGEIPAHLACPEQNGDSK